jgi:hypothetical protein
VKKPTEHGWVLVAHSCNPSYSGSRDQEASLGKEFLRSYLKKNPSQKRAGRVAQGEGTESRPSTAKNKQTKPHRTVEHICKSSI